MSDRAPGILARGPWAPEDVSVRWDDAPYAASPEADAAADATLAELAERGSPTHDGMAARMARLDVGAGGVDLVCQPMRWSLRLGDDAADSLSALCVVRDADGRWLAGRRAAWVASWPGRWALGAGGSVEVGENPVETLPRELHEEWSLVPDRLTVEALIRIPSGHGDAGRPGAGGRRVGAGHGPRARRARVVAARPGRLARGGRPASTPDGHTAGRGITTPAGRRAPP